jgi:hypothetical protein
MVKFKNHDCNRTESPGIATVEGQKQRVAMHLLNLDSFTAWAVKCNENNSTVVIWKD